MLSISSKEERWVLSISVATELLLLMAQEYNFKYKDGMYIGMGAKEISFAE